jgi:hypothetical protein
MDQPMHTAGSADIDVRVVDIKVTFGLVWAFFWRMFVISLLFYVVVLVVAFLVFGAIGLSLSNVLSSYL